MCLELMAHVLNCRQRTEQTLRPDLGEVTATQHGPPPVQTATSPRPSPRPGQCRQVDAALQNEAQRERPHRPDHRLQRGNAGCQEEQEARRRDPVGRGGSAEDARTLAEVPPERSGRGVRGGRLGPCPPGGGTHGAGEDAPERAAARLSAHPARQQAGRERRVDRHRAEGQVQAEEDVLGSGLVRSALLRHDGRRSRGGLQESGPNGKDPLGGRVGQYEDSVHFDGAADGELHSESPCLNSGWHVNRDL